MEINILPFDRDPAYPPHPLLMHTLDTRVVQVAKYGTIGIPKKTSSIHPLFIIACLSSAFLPIHTYTLLIHTYPRSRDIFVVIKLYTDSFTKIHLFWIFNN